MKVFLSNCTVTKIGHVAYQKCQQTYTGKTQDPTFYQNLATAIKTFSSKSINNTYCYR